MRRWGARGALLVVLVGAVTWVSLGVSLAVLDSASMEPWASPGALLVHRSAARADVEVGDVITVPVPGRGLVTHRVVAVEGGAAELQGDASRFPDPDPVRLPEEVDRVVLVVPRLGTVLRVAGPWLAGALVLLGMGGLALRLTTRSEPDDTPAVASDPTPPLDPRIEALLATCEQFEEDGVPRPVLADLVRVRTAAVVGLPSAERSGAVLSLDDGGRFYVLAVADADPAMLDLVPVDSERRRAGTGAVELWWDAVSNRVPGVVATAIASWHEAADAT